MANTLENRRVLIYSASFGGGHTAMARALREYYRDHYAGSVSVDVVDMLEELAPSLNVLAKFAYQQDDVFFPPYRGTFEQLAKDLPGNPAVQGARESLLPAVRAQLEQARPDAVIALHTFLGGVATEVGGGGMHHATLVSTFDARGQWLHPGTDLHFCAGRTTREQLTLDGAPWDRVVESGIPVREQFAQRVAREHAQGRLGLAEKFTVLLRADHGKPADTAELATRLLGSGVQVVALTSGNDRMMARLEKESVKDAALVLFDRVDDVNELMAAADVLVSRPGGLMVYEACAAGLPTILSPPMPGQEQGNVDFLVNYGAALLARGSQDVVDKVRFLSTHQRRIEQMSESAGLVGKGRSTQTLCERVLAATR